MKDESEKRPIFAQGEVVKITVGRVVHYFATASSNPSAAMVTDVNGDGSVELTVLVPGAFEFVSHVPKREPLGGSTWGWDWPQRSI